MTATPIRLWLALAALVAGIVAGAAWGTGAIPLACAVVGTSALTVRRSLAALAAIACLAFGLGWIDAGVRIHRDSPVQQLAHDVPSCAFDGRVTDENALGAFVRVARLDCDGYPSVRAPGAVVMDDRGGLEVGARVRGRGYLVPLRFDDFDRAAYRQGADARLEARTVEVSAPRSPPLRVASAIRGGLQRAVEGVPRLEGGLLQGLAIGETGALDPVTLDRFRRSGLSHLLAVSGENVAIVFAVVMFLLRGRALVLRVSLAAAGLLLYVLVVGTQPSVLRAGLMGAVGLLALASGRRSEPLNALAVAGIVLVALRPDMVFSAGLQLSAAATIGIVVCTEPFARALRRLPRAVRLPLAATLGAQLGVAPVLVLVFGQLSLVAPLANLLAFPAVAPGTVLGLAAAISGALVPPLGRLLGHIAAPFAWWILRVADVFGAPSWAAAELPRWAGFALGILAAVVLVGCARSSAKRASARGGFTLNA